MKKLLFFGLFFYFFFSANLTLVAQYSNATLNGPWWMALHPFQIYDDQNTNYLVFDGNGNIVAGSMFCGSINGTYSVSASGAILGSFGCDGTFFPISGQLNSQDFAPMGQGWALSRIMNPGALTDSLVGILYTASCGQNNVILRLNSQGQIISASGLTNPVTGRVYSDSGHFEGHIKTGDVTYPWDQFTIIGAQVNDSLTGFLFLDQNGCDGTVHLKRMGQISGIAPISVSPLDLIVYPNPSTGKFTITFPSATKEIQISNSMGQLVQTLYVDNQKSLEFELSDNGIYFILLKNDKQTLTRKVVICR